jgi:hypothetical protein
MAKPLLKRVREALAREKGVHDIKMMGGLSFMIGDIWRWGSTVRS